MKFNEYIKLAVRTEFKLKDNRERRLHAILGLASEINEVTEAACSDNTSNHIEEVGDVGWYTAVLCDAINYPENEMDQPITVHGLGSAKGHLPYIVSYLADAAKREYILGKVYDAVPYFIGCTHLLNWLRVQGNSLGIPLEAICARNIDKLKLRYPTKFSNEASDLRDTKAEEAIFMKPFVPPLTDRVSK